MKSENTSNKVTSQIAAKGISALPASPDLVVKGLEQISKTSTDSLKDNMSDYWATERVLIKELGGMRTNGKDPEQDRKVEDYLMQIHNDHDKKETEQADRIVLKDNTDKQWVFYGLGFLSYAALLLGISKHPGHIDFRNINFYQMGKAASRLFSKHIGK